VVGLLAPVARAEKPLIAVLPFDGPQAKRAEAVVVRALRGKAKLLPFTRWKASAKKLFASSHSADDISSVAQDLDVKVVITGVVKRDGRAWQLAVTVRDGPSGHARDKLKYPLKGPRLESDSLDLLADEVGKAFEHTLAAAGGAEEEEEAPKKPPRKPPVAEAPPPSLPPPARAPVAKAPPAPPVEEREEAPSPAAPPVAEREETPPGMAAPTEKAIAVKTTPPGQRRPRWAPYFDVSIGAGVGGRTFDFQPASLPSFKTGSPAVLRADLTLYPLAGTWRTAKGVFAGLGLGATIDKPFWKPSTGPDMNPYATDELNVSGGLRWRIPVYKAIPRPEIVILAGGGYHSFTIEKRVDMVTGNLVDVGPPDIGMAYLAFGLGFRLHFAEWARLWVSFQYHLVLDAGPVVTAAEYGPATVNGYRPAGGLEFFVYRGLKISVSGFYERYELTFVGSDPPPAKPGNGQLAQSAVDQYFGGVLTLGYEL
jgi:outer membrane biosynthesis protein TonB